jgi:hypothetical protein
MFKAEVAEKVYLVQRPVSDNKTSTTAIDSATRMLSDLSD